MREVLAVEDRVKPIGGYLKNALASVKRFAGDIGDVVPSPLNPLLVQVDGLLRKVDHIILRCFGSANKLTPAAAADWIEGLTFDSIDETRHTGPDGLVGAIELPDNGTCSIIIILRPEDRRWNPPRREA